MKTTVKTLRLCPSCLKPVPAGVLAGLCPACLLVQGAESDDGAGSARFEPPPIPEVAKLFPQLEILDLLGAGGMGAVYKARQPALDRIVALKILPAGGPGGANFAERFNREARALARLNHPNIVAVYEFGQAGGLHYFLMEFVDGANLRLLEQGSRLSPREALQIIPQICDALQYAHDEGVVHRDIKPENVLVDRKGRVKIADFGLAKIMGVDADATRLTGEGQVMGTLHYMAPEQVARPLAVDHRADIYSLGVVLYEMLTGDLPLGKFSPPSHKVQVDVKFDEIVLRALENDPSRRYQRASEVKTRVETISPEPVPASGNPAAGSDDRFLGWMGFAVVRESGGQRSIHWKGAFTALGITFGLLSLAFAFVTAFTDRSLFGWLGIKGWPSVVARLVITGALVSWGVWRAKRAGTGAEPLPETPRGTVMLASSRRRWLIGRRVVAASLMVLAWLAFERSWITPLLQKWFAESPSSQAAALDEGTGTLIARLPGGGEVELLGLSSTDAADGRWWRADGTPVTNDTLTITGPAGIATPGLEKRDLAFRIAGIPRERDSLIYDFEPAANVSDGGAVTRNGKELSGGWPIRTGWPGFVLTATLRLGYSRDPWRTIWTYNPAEHSTRRLELESDPKWITSLNQVRDDGTDTYLTMVLGPNTKNWRLRIAAVGIDGVERFHERASGTPSENSTTWTYTFPGMTLKQVKEFQLQVRPLRWVEFRDVALWSKEGAKLNSAAEQFGSVVERAFDELLDLDTGMIGRFPSGDSTGNPFADMGKNMAWMQEHGFDLAASVDHIDALGLKVAKLSGADWDSLTPTGLLGRLRDAGTFPGELKPEADQKTPAVFGFQTREGGAGMLRIVRLGGPDSGAVVRFRLVQPSAEESERKSVGRDPADLREAKAHLAELKVIRGEGNSEVKAARARIAELERMAREEPNAPAELRDAKARLAELRISFGDVHPEVQQALARIQVLEGK